MRILLALSFFLLAHTLHAQPLKVPPGFEVTEFADGKLANDIHVMTIDPRGRVVVAGRGYIRILVDDDGDGKADRAIDFADSPKDGAMGLLWEGDSLYVTGDGGLRRFKIKNDKADGPSELLRAMKTGKTGGEHSAHAIRRGPDGWLYVLCGNNTGIDKTYAELPTSPIKDPVAGAVLRFSPLPTGGEGPGVRGFAKCEIVAHGFRNPYAMDFNLDGDLFTFDSDNERCVSLPWYEPTRFYHVIDGRHYGWLNPQHAITWRRPPYFCDVVAPIATLGRGSPTGVVCYAHNQFPSEYHGGFFLGDWTFGKIHFATLQRKGASYTATTKVFLESLGDNGFAPTACAIDPTTGDLYVSIGGRGTRGAVYRVRHPERYAAIKDKLGPYTMAKRSLEWKEGMKKEIEDKITQSNAVGVLTAEAHERLWALQMLRRHNSQWDDKAFSTFFPRAMATLAKDSDLHVRQALADLVERTMQRANPKDALPDNLQAFANRYVAAYRFNPWVRRPTTDEDHLFCLRLMQLSLGDVGARNAIGTIWEGYTRRNEKFAVKELDELKADIGELKTYAADFPMRRANVDREIARTLAMVGWDDPNVRWLVLRRTGAETDPVDDIHYLACYAQLGGKRTDKETPLVAATLLDLDRKIAARKLNRDSNWAPRVSELYVGLVEKNAALHQAMLEHPAFGRSDHALFANTPGFPKERAARIFLERWAKDGNFALTGNIVQLFDAVPAADVLPTVRKRWGETGQEAALLPLLAKAPMASDRGKFIEGLKSPQAATVEACVKGLNVIGAKSDASESFALIRALQQQANQSTDKKTPAANAGRLAKLVADRLEKTTGQAFATDSKRWIAWLQETHPEFGKRLANPDGVDVGKWDQRLAKLDWDNGNAAAGKVVFSKASCLTCHSGSQALGPDLVGVTGRFSRADVLTAIIQPSKDVPTRYQTTVLETKDGKTYQGIVIYDAVDSLILQTGAATTVRLDGGQVVSRFVSAQSLMPAGLLDPLSDREIVDLYAYLRELGKK